MIRHRFIVLLAFTTFLRLSLGAATPPLVEVVQTVPVETSLAVPGIRESLEVWLEMIQGATTSLDIEQFYLSDKAGEPLAPVLAAIQEAGKRGVKVRLLADSKFFKTYPESILAIGATKSSEARLIDFSKFGGGIQHAKFFVVDRKEVFSGSQNFDWRALKHIHEVGLRVVDAAAAEKVTAVFEKDWAMGTVAKPGGNHQEALTDTVAVEPAALSADILETVASPPAANPAGVNPTEAALVKLISGAKKEIRVQVMDYSTKGSGGKPWLVLDKALKAAAARGVKVRLIVDVGHVKNANAELKSLAKTKNVEVGAITIPEWSGGKIDYARLVHSKYLVADGGDCWVGSENWSEGYFRASRDLGFVVHSAEVSAKLVTIFDQLWASKYNDTL